MDDLRQKLQTAREGGPARLLAVCAEELAALRSMDQGGAARLCRSLIAAGGDDAELAKAIEELSAKHECVGCGTCCLTSSPTLYLADLHLFEPGGTGLDKFYTLRAGERVYSARLGQVQTLDQDLIKLRENPAGGCLFLNEGRCGIYEQRPLQCRNLECWSGRDAGTLADRPRLGRAEIFSEDETALALATEYDVKLPAAELAQALDRAASGDQSAAASALQMIEMDHRLRGGISMRYGYTPEVLDLLLGRPAMVVCRAHGLDVVVDDHGTPQLSRPAT